MKTSPQIKLEFVNPFNISDWNNLVLQCTKYSIFHSKEWSELLVKIYDYKPYFPCNFENQRMTFFLPFMQIRSKFTGKRLVSLPFSDYCEPIIIDEYFSEFLNTIKDVCGYSSAKSFSGHWDYRIPTLDLVINTELEYFTIILAQSQFEKS